MMNERYNNLGLSVYRVNNWIILKNKLIEGNCNIPPCICGTEDKYIVLLNSCVVTVLVSQMNYVGLIET